MTPEIHPVYGFVWQIFAFTLTATLLQPIMLFWMPYAYRIWNGRQRIDEDFEDELWSRSAYASIMTSAAAVSFVLLDYLCTDPDWLGLPPGPIHAVFWISFLSLAAFFMYYCYHMDDFFAGLSLAVIYLYIPVVLLSVLWWLIGWNWLFTYVRSWLKEPLA